MTEVLTRRQRYEQANRAEINRRAREKRAENIEARREAESTRRASFTPEIKAARAKYQRDWYQRNRAQAMLLASRTRAKQKGWDHDITLDDIVIPETCPVLGIPMTRPSLDRFDNRLGYVKGNVRVISMRANELKRDATLEEMIAVVAYMSSRS